MILDFDIFRINFRNFNGNDRSQSSQSSDSALYLPTTDVNKFCLLKLTIQLTYLPDFIVKLLVVYLATVN